MSTKKIIPENDDSMNDEENQYKSGGKQIRILVVDDHPLDLAEGWKGLLGPL